MHQAYESSQSDNCQSSSLINVLINVLIIVDLVRILLHATNVRAILFSTTLFPLCPIGVTVFICLANLEHVQQHFFLIDEKTEFVMFMMYILELNGVAFV